MEAAGFSKWIVPIYQLSMGHIAGSSYEFMRSLLQAAFRPYADGPKILLTFKIHFNIIH